MVDLPRSTIQRGTTGERSIALPARAPTRSYHFTLTHVNGTEYSDPGKVRASTVKVSY